MIAIEYHVSSWAPICCLILNFGETVVTKEGMPCGVTCGSMGVTLAALAATLAALAVHQIPELIP